MEFKDRLKEIMEIRDINQTQLSKITGIRQSSINDYLSGKYQAKQDKLDKLSIVLNVSPAWLMGKINMMERNDPRIDKSLMSADSFQPVIQAVHDTISKTNITKLNEFPANLFAELQQICSQCLLVEIQEQLNARNK